MSQSVLDTAAKYIAPAFERKPKSVVAINVTELTSYADVLAIIEGGSNRQVSALAGHIITRLKKEKIIPLSVEGLKEGEWVLIDYGDAILHIFESSTKVFYDLEGLWADAPRLDLSSVERYLPSESEDGLQGERTTGGRRMTSTKPVNILMILDGWGINESLRGNAVAMADTPFLDSLMDRYPSCRLHCSGNAVGLPEGTMGNSEVGHMNIGAGRKVLQDLVRINTAIKENTFDQTPALVALMTALKQKKQKPSFNGTALRRRCPQSYPASVFPD